MDNKKQSKVDEVINAYKNLDKNIKSDINGSYTGVPLDDTLYPIQDADDL